MNHKRLFARLSQGHLQNVSFRELVALAEALGFHLVRISGSHHVFSHPEVRELLNLQEVRGKGKPYQIRQLLRLVERYNLHLEAEP